MDYYMVHKDNTGAGTDELVTSRLINAAYLAKDSGLLPNTTTALVRKMY